MDIKKIIANNLISLRKKHNLTQNELAEKINYSDNAISRWERGEVTPSIETLVQISEIFQVPLASLLEDNAVKKANEFDKNQMIKKLSVILLFVSLIWLAATITYVYGQLIFKKNLWTLFVWAVPCSCLLLLYFNKYWGKYIFQFVILSVLQWTLLASIYLQFLEYNLWLIFIIGVPLQAGLSCWSFIKPKKHHNNNNNDN